MPTYAYLCGACGHAFEMRMSIREKEEWKRRCPACGSRKVEQQLFGFSFGSGGGGGSAPAPGG
jgi:putative FmdB family regulatory protein